MDMGKSRIDNITKKNNSVVFKHNGYYHEIDTLGVNLYFDKMN